MYLVCYFNNPHIRCFIFSEFVPQRSVLNTVGKTNILPRSPSWGKMSLMRHCVVLENTILDVGCYIRGSYSVTELWIQNIKEHLVYRCHEQVNTKRLWEETTIVTITMFVFYTHTHKQTNLVAITFLIILNHHQTHSLEAEH